MNLKILRLIVLLAGLLSLAAHASPAKAATVGPFEVVLAKVLAGSKEPDTSVLVALRNAGKAPVEDVRFRLGAGCCEVSSTARMESLVAGQESWIKVTAALSVAPSYLVIDYTADGRRLSLARSLDGNEKLPKPGVAATAVSTVPALLALVGALGGAVLAHRLTARRDKRRGDLEWHKSLVERYEPKFRRLPLKLGDKHQRNSSESSVPETGVLHGSAGAGPRGV